MRILVTNDDGIEASGLITLASMLAEAHEVYVVAPDRERSATGHAITMHKPIYPKPVAWSSQVASVWKVNGTPADCVKLGVEALLPEPPEMICSGINHGSNLGRDVFYSGTVSAAMEGMFLGVASMALSAKSFDLDSLQWIAQFMRQWVGSSLFHKPLAGEFFNINFPDLVQQKPSQLVWVGLGHREYRDEFHRYQNPRGETYFWLSGQPWDRLDGVASDVSELESGHITATPLNMDVTARDRLSELPGVDLTTTSVGADSTG